VPWLDLARSEREDFAAFLETLSPQQWEAPTLCERWNVRQVAAHAISFDELRGGALVRRFLKGWLRVDRINQVGVDDYADHTAADLIALIRAHAEPHGLTAGFGGRVALTDNMIHQQDIRRPLGLPRTIDDRRLRVALDFALTSPTIRGARRTKRLRLVATDLDWSHGGGPEVRGPGEALLMVMAGRGHALKDLEGPGKDQLADRLLRL
jgi:uncharacterized protein (TIGR03083 family)